MSKEAGQNMYLALPLVSCEWGTAPDALSMETACCTSGGERNVLPSEYLLRALGIEAL